MDAFNEYMVKRKINGVDRLKIAGIIIGGIALMFVLLMFAPRNTFYAE